MGIKTTFIDDLDGSDLGEEATPETFTLNGKSYSIYLSEANSKKLADALGPFIKNAEPVATRAASASKPKSDAAKKERNQKVRAWAQAENFKYTDSNGVEKTLGDRGQIPDVVFEAYEAAN